MAVRKPKVQKQRVRTCETLTLQRANQLAGYGKRAAILAKSRGKTVDDFDGYCPLIGDNTTAAWISGWNKEWGI